MRRTVPAVESALRDPITMSEQEQLQATLGSAYIIERELGGGGMSHR